VNASTSAHGMIYGMYGIVRWWHEACADEGLSAWCYERIAACNLNGAIGFVIEEGRERAVRVLIHCCGAHRFVLLRFDQSCNR
jgi:hypothetical protein